jgi:hypothetical protein
LIAGLDLYNALEWHDAAPIAGLLQPPGDLTNVEQYGSVADLDLTAISCGNSRTNPL